MSVGSVGATFALWAWGLGSLGAFVALLGLVGFMAMGPDALLSGAGAMDAGSRRQAATAAGIINGVGSIGPIVQEPLIGWLKVNGGVDSVLMVLVVMATLAAGGSGLFWWSDRRQRLAAAVV
jgi:sugar phosphate permease